MQRAIAATTRHLYQRHQADVRIGQSVKKAGDTDACPKPCLEYLRTKVVHRTEGKFGFGSVKTLAPKQFRSYEKPNLNKDRKYCESLEHD